MRTFTLLEASERILQDGEAFNHVMKEFIDGVFLADDKQSLINEQPLPLCTDDPHLDINTYNVILAGLADELADRFSLQRPQWVTLPEYYLDKPLFTCNENPEKRAILLVETPAYYRARNLFCGKILNDMFA